MRPQRSISQLLLRPSLSVLRIELLVVLPDVVEVLLSARVALTLLPSVGKNEARDALTTACAWR